MGLSGFKGQVYWIDDSCPTITCDAYGSPEVVGQVCWADEITRFTIEDSVQKREYGHDKSQGWQDVVAGIRRLGITLNANYTPRDGTEDPPARAGRVVWLMMYPAGDGCSEPVMGYAMLDRITYTVDQERGDPISYVATLSSKGPWSGFQDTGEWGGFECGCGSGQDF